MCIMVEFDEDGVLYPITSNIKKHEEARLLAESFGKKSYKFFYINVEGISKQFLLDD